MIVPETNPLYTSFVPIYESHWDYKTHPSKTLYQCSGDSKQHLIANWVLLEHYYNQ